MRSTRSLLDLYRTFLLTIYQYWTGLFDEDQISLFDQYQASLDQYHTTGQIVCVLRGSTGFRAPGSRRPAITHPHGKFSCEVHSCCKAEPEARMRRLYCRHVSSCDAAVSAAVTLPCQQL